jgi:hypothetical protein
MLDVIQALSIVNRTVKVYFKLQSFVMQQLFENLSMNYMVEDFGCMRWRKVKNGEQN